MMNECRSRVGTEARIKSDHRELHNIVADETREQRWMKLEF